MTKEIKETMASTTTCQTEQVIEITSKYNASSMAGLTLVGNSAFCVKSKKHEEGVADSSIFISYNDYEVAKQNSVIQLTGYITYGMTYYNKNFYITCDKKRIIQKPLDTNSLTVFSVDESDVRAIAYYTGGKFILMGNDKNTNNYIYFMIGKFDVASHKFVKEKAFYVKNLGYDMPKDIYYSSVNGLFVITNDSNYRSCKNKILRVALRNSGETYQGEIVYNPVTIIDVNFDTAKFLQHSIESMALDLYGRIIMTSDVVRVSGAAYDCFDRSINIAYKRRRRVQISCKTSNGVTVPNVTKSVSGVNTKFSNLSGMALSGKKGFFVKNSSAQPYRNVLYVYPDYTKSEKQTYLLSGAGLAYGITCKDNTIYVSYGSSIKQYSATGADINTYTTGSWNIQSIAYYKDDQFVVMDSSMTAGSYLKIGIVKFVNGQMAVSEIYYIANQGYTRLQDIYYSDKWGLFIASNDYAEATGYKSCKNIIVRVELSQFGENYLDGKLLNAASKWLVNFSQKTYKQCNIESLAIDAEGKINLACNIVPQSGAADGMATDGLMQVNNIAFEKEGYGIIVNTTKILDIPPYNNIGVPGSLALNGNEAYCVITNTGTDEESYFMDTVNYRTNKFVVKKELLHDMGHGNGGAYYKNDMYIAAYRRSPSAKKIVVLKLDDRNNLNNNKTIIECGFTVGGIAHYKDNQFILIDYTTSSSAPYAKNIICKMAEITKSSEGQYSMVVDDSKNFVVNNPYYIDSGVLQDAHYEPEIGLFISESSNKKHHVLRVDIDSCMKETGNITLKPIECYYPLYSNGNKEIESMSIDMCNKMMLALQNGNSDALVSINDIVFNHEF